jgi:predicted nucleic acid-binding protein
VIVIDTSAMVEYLLGTDQLGDVVGEVVVGRSIVGPHGLDLEFANALRRLVLSGHTSEEAAHLALATLRSMPITRHPHTMLLDRIWELRDNMWPYDAAFVALAEALGAPLVTVDGKFQGVPGLRCEIHNLRAGDN